MELAVVRPRHRIVVRDRDALRLAIAERGYSHRRFALEIGSSKSHIGQILNGERNPSPSTARNMAAKLHVPFKELFAVVGGGADGSQTDADSVRSPAS